MVTLRLAALGLLGAGMVMLSGCGKSKPPPPPPAKHKPAKPTELTQKQAAELACKLANEAFLDQKFRNPQGERVHVKAALRPTSWQAADKQKGRWVFRYNPTKGPQADVSFDLDGKRPSVSVDFKFE